MWPIALVLPVAALLLAIPLLSRRRRRHRHAPDQRLAPHLWREVRLFHTLASHVGRYVDHPQAARALLLLADQTLQRLREHTPRDPALHTALERNQAWLAQLAEGRWPEDLVPPATTDDDLTEEAAIARRRLLLNDALRLMHRARHRGLISAEEHLVLDLGLRLARTRLDIHCDIARGDAAQQRGDAGLARSHFNRAQRRLAEENGLAANDPLRATIAQRRARLDTAAPSATLGVMR